MNTTYNFPAILTLCQTKNIRLHLGPCKVVKTQAGRWCLVSPIFGAGYYGSFRDTGEFRPTRECKPEFIELLQKVETDGLAAVAAIGLATGHCCICGRVLTNEDSIRGGIGPVCGEKVGYVAPESTEEF
jgi:Family of unknown function (DUF6011)